MKFLLDVHISTRVARALIDNGHDVVRAALAYPTWSDARLLALAVAEIRIIVTEDRDFSDLVYAFFAPAPPAIIYIRCEPEDQVDVAERILDVLKDTKHNGHMVVIKPSNTRYRPLPAVSNDNA